MSVEVHDHTDEVLGELAEAIEAGLTGIGNQAESHAKNNVKAAGRKDTGALQNSITNEVRTGEKAVYIGREAP